MAADFDSRREEAESVIQLKQIVEVQQQELEVLKQIVELLQNRVLEPVENNSSLVSHETDSETGMEQGENKIRDRVVPAAMQPRDYINNYLDDHIDVLDRLIEDHDFGYRELAKDISDFYGMDFSHVTVHRTVKKRVK